jgi:hypothetical protein
VDTLAPAIRAIANQPAVAVSTWTPALPAETTAATAEPATAAESCTASARATSAATSRSSWNTSGLAFHRGSAYTAWRALESLGWAAAQSKIVLAVLQAGAERSIHQERFVRVGAVLWSCNIRRRSGCKLIDFVLGSGPETALLLALRTFGHLSLAWLQFESPFYRRRRARTDLHVFARGLKPEHLHFDLVGSWCEIRQFVIARLIGGGQRAMFALGSDHGGAGQRLPTELHRSRLRDARLPV